MSGVPKSAVLKQIHGLSRPLRVDQDLNGILRRAGDCRFVAIGGASHGTHEFHTWRETLSRRLVAEEGYTWIGVEADWPDCWRINNWVRGHDAHQGVHGLLAGFGAWPAWLWANEEVAAFLDWLRTFNAARPERRRVGFYGLDVYSRRESTREVLKWLADHPAAAAEPPGSGAGPIMPGPADMPAQARGDPTEPQWETDVVALLKEVRGRAFTPGPHDEDTFNAVQNAEVAADADRYYRTMVRGGREAWNGREHHMADTLDRLGKHAGPAGKGIVWAHNSHVGDARGTDLARDGLVSLGQLLRDRHAAEGVLLVGLAAHRGSVLASEAWGGPARVFPVDAARAGSQEDFLHEALGVPAVLDFGEDRSGPWLSTALGHRTIGLIHAASAASAAPAAPGSATPGSGEPWGYVPTRMGECYDALLWLERTAALRPVRPREHPGPAEFQTAPTGL